MLTVLKMSRQIWRKYEWIKVYGVLFGCEDQMNNLFDQAVKDAGDDAVSQAKVQTEK